MTLKKYKQIKLFFVVLISIVFGQSLVYKNFITPIAVLMVSSLVLMFIRGRVKEIVSDERDRVVAGNAALLAMQIYSWVSVIFIFSLYSFKDVNPFYQPMAFTMAFSVLFLMVLYAIIFRFNNRVKSK